MTTSHYDLDAILFENREKSYGAYMLRTQYVKFLSLATGFCVALVFTAVGVPYCYGKYFKTVTLNHVTHYDPIMLKDLPKTTKKEDIPKIQEIPLTQKDIPAPPKQEIPLEKPAAVKTVAVKIPEPKPKTEVMEEKTILSTEETKESPVSTKSQEGEKAAPNFIPIEDGKEKGTGKFMVIEDKSEKTPPTKSAPQNPEQNNRIPDEKEFIMADQRPQPVNLMDIKKAIGYPPIARDAGIEGEILINILINEEGNYMKHVVKTPGNALLVREIEKHVAQLRFTPAIRKQKAIKFWIIVPFKFELKSH
jgi:protein TonB